jgi:hypothetical protein
MRQQYGAGGAAAVKHVVASHQRPHRGRDRRTRRPSQPGCQGVARNSRGAAAAHARIVAGARTVSRSIPRRARRSTQRFPRSA